jgi:hypothetical protein
MISILVATGFMCRHTRPSGFKLAVVVGYSENKMRVRYWRAASKKWTLPTLVEADELTGLNEGDYAKHRATIKRAAQVALDLKLVGRVWS